MKNKKINLISNYVKIFILVFVFVLAISYIFYNIKATNVATVYLLSNKTNIEKGEKIEITVCIENAKTAAYDINMYFDNTKLEYVSGPENTNAIENRIISVWYDQTGGNEAKEGELAKYILRAKEDGKVVFYIQGGFYDSLGNLIETNFREIEVQIGEKKENVSNINQTIQAEISDITDNNIQNDNMSNTNLETLAIENVLLYPPFDTNITHYDIEISNEINQLNILAVPENELASVHITGNDSLKEGTNLIQITVIAQNGYSKKVFEVNCYKRNKEEEVLFQKEQEENRKKLEEIYQVERISSKDGEAEVVGEKEIKRSAWSVIIIILVILIAVIVGLRKKYRGTLK